MPKGFLLGRKEVLGRLRSALDELVKEFQAKNTEAWKRACLAAADAYKLEVRGREQREHRPV